MPQQVGEQILKHAGERVILSLTLPKPIHTL